MSARGQTQINERSYRRFAADEKRVISNEVAQPGVTLSGMCCKHSVSPTLVYRWRAIAQHATTQALQKVDSRGKSPTRCAHSEAASRAGPQCHVVVEIIAGNFELKKR